MAGMYDGASGEQTKTPAPADYQQIYHIGIRDADPEPSNTSDSRERRGGCDEPTLEASFESGLGAVAPASTDVRGARRVGLAADS